MDFIIENNKSDINSDILSDFQTESLRNRIQAFAITPFGDLNSSNPEEINKTLAWYFFLNLFLLLIN